MNTLRHKYLHKIKEVANLGIIRPMTTYIKDSIKKSDLVGVEIGTCRGINAKNILTTLSIKHLYLIDSYEGVWNKYEGEARKLLSGYNGMITIIKKKSMDAVNDIPYDVDFVYIDGNHDYEFVKQDIQCYYPKVSNGGIIGGHDFSVRFHGVARAVIEFAVECKKELQGIGQDWWIVK